ncbi:hypothetical protein [Rhodococcus tibetensis]|uniref:Uncharacterized protein n=1 Tax=Rhodococcus tibetensis TaxID=2965064 RepID=A0ABT1Q8U9_9NOCA|nr:hypothetical protein [Rhodococcus sp. FXJ9.536]MCQ4118685.1 hypothetical protein [Rhodococcus sp. FXJ9.536]
MSTAHVRHLIDYIEAELPQGVWPHWTEGWPREIEAGLLDAAFSARATYGTPTSGVRAVIARWRAHRGEPLDDLAALAEYADEPAALIAVLDNRQRVPGNYTTKAEAVALAARSLVAAGCRQSSELRDEEVRRNALVQIAGFGNATWECFTMQLGVCIPESRELLKDFVIDALAPEVEVTSTTADELLAAAATRLDVSPATLTHAIWRYQRAQRRLAGAR